MTKSDLWDLQTVLQRLEALAAPAGDPDGERCSINQDHKDAVRGYLTMNVTPLVARLVTKWGARHDKR